MKSLRLKRGRIAGALVVMLLLTCLYIPAVNAADAINTNTKCSLTLEVPTDSAYNQDTNKPAITAKLYRVASVSESRHFTMIDTIPGVDIETLSQSDSTDWAAAAQTAASVINRTPDTTVTLTNGTGKASGLETGMYLVMMDTVTSKEYEYTFTPYFISLPNNLYYSTQKPTDDSWVYDATSFIKIGQAPRYGSIVIEKTLESYNESLGQVTFAYTVEGKKAGVTNYSNAAMITFNKAGIQTTILTGIPALTTVTVTEAYTGASYTLSTAPDQTASIIADGDEGSPVKVSFTNTYNNETKKGYGVANHFSYNNGEWSWEQLENNSASTTDNAQ